MEFGKRRMKAIVTVDGRWAIGKDGAMLARNPVDMKFFRETTGGQAVVMGRKTLESLPGGKPLKNRINVVLSKSRPGEAGWTDDEQKTFLAVVSSREELFRILKRWPDREIFLIGGGMLYRDLLSECDTAYVTYMKNVFPEADTWFPNLDEDPKWERIRCGEWQTYESLTFSFRTYQRRA